MWRAFFFSGTLAAMARIFGQRRLNEDQPLYVRALGIKVGDRVFEIGDPFPWHKLEGVTPRLVRLLFEQRKISHERMGVDKPVGAEGGTSKRERERMQRERDRRKAEADAERAKADRDRELARDAARREHELRAAQELDDDEDDVMTQTAIAQSAAGDALPQLPRAPVAPAAEVTKSAQRAGGRDVGRR